MAELKIVQFSIDDFIVYKSFCGCWDSIRRGSLAHCQEYYRAHTPVATPATTPVATCYWIEGECPTCGTPRGFLQVTKTDWDRVQGPCANQTFNLNPWEVTGYGYDMGITNLVKLQACRCQACRCI